LSFLFFGEKRRPKEGTQGVCGLFPGPCKNLGPLFQDASILAKVARMESLGACKSPSIGESKSSIREMAEATQIAQTTIDK
jgi:hypothetical protein